MKGQFSLEIITLRPFIFTQLENGYDIKKKDRLCVNIKISKQDEELVMLVPNHYVLGTTVLFIWHKNILPMMVKHS